MNEKPLITTLIKEWYRKWCHERYDNVPKHAIPAALKELFEVIKFHGYSYEDIGESNLKRIEDHCTAKKKEYKFSIDSWESKARAHVRNISRTVFEPKYFGNVSPEEIMKVEIAAEEASGQAEFEDNFKYKPLDRSLIKKDVVIDNSYDEEFMKLLEIPEEFRE